MLPRRLVQRHDAHVQLHTDGTVLSVTPRTGQRRGQHWSQRVRSRLPAADAIPYYVIWNTRRTPTGRRNANAGCGRGLPHALRGVLRQEGEVAGEPEAKGIAGKWRRDSARGIVFRAESDSGVFRT